ncbi:EAL domain-containing protein [Methylovorus menthalis]|uniref:EAL domain-containing protein n=1 Tax=Methylovorus menthalis TaxID=1002227 RepID=UPI001E34411F|nr:EAL domain-containing protein [Methylovorus menthalis]MCB4811038.1 EAL domain-containing protein [Methylovorus menthalis]
MLRILMVEDSPTDAELSLRELKRAGLTCEIKRVETEQDFRDQIQDYHPQLILSDYSLPQFDGMSALHIAREVAPEIPFIFVSGTIGEETAILSLKNGATDYIIKNNLSRLPSAVISALERAEEKVVHRRMERELENSNRLFRVFMQNLPAIAFIKDQHGQYIFANASTVDALQLPHEEIIGKHDSMLFPPQLAKEMRAAEQQMLAQGEAIQHVRQFPQADDFKLWLLTTFPVQDMDGNFNHIGGIGIDITEQRKVEEALLLRNHAIEASATPILIVDVTQPAMPLIYVNRAFEQVTGYPSQEAIGRNCRFLQGHDHDQPELEKIRTAIRERCPGYAILRNYRKDGSLFWNELYVAPVPDVNGGPPRYFVGVQKDITEIRQYQETLERQANYDTLTGLANRNLLKERMHQAISEARRHNWMFSVAFVDIDNFKRINDSMGHSAGDELIRLLGQRLQSCLRDGDTVARLGGDEFVLLLTSQSLDESIHTVVQRIRNTIINPFIITGKQLTITCSIGLANFPQDGRNADTLLSNADSAMYQAKANGSNNFRFYAKEMNAELGHRLSLENDLWHALEKQQLVLHYQPQVCMSNGKIIGMEALIRWQHPTLGLIPPLQFIPLSEDDGLIVPIGIWVMETAANQNRQLQQAGHPPIRVAVNLSVRQLEQKDLVHCIERTLQHSGLDPTCLELEITESMLMHNIEESIVTLNRISDLGVQLSLDDFGTGYSSLSYLKRLPINRLKIDKSFINDIPTTHNDAVIARSIIALAHSLEIQVIAEGVESAEQYAFLRENGCDEVQGYLLSRPRPFAEIEALLQAGGRLALPEI